METVVEVGMPRELKIPLRATSIIPLEVTAPKNTPKLAIIMMFLTEIALEPIAEFKKFTASLLTPTTKSTIAKTAKATSIKIYGSPILFFKFNVANLQPQKVANVMFMLYYVY